MQGRQLEDPSCYIFIPGLVALLGKVAAVPGKLGQWTGEEAEGSRVVEVPRDLLG
jgi:hypothetical protein